MPAPEASPPVVGVVVLHHRNWPTVAHTLDALQAQHGSPSRIVVVDNASSDGSVDRIRERFPDVEVLEAAENGGYAAGMNLGAAHLGDSVDVMAFLTHECILEEGALATLARRLADAPEVGVVGPLLVWSDDTDRVWSAGGVVEGPTLRLGHENTPDERCRWEGSEPRPVPWVDGACAVVRREVFERVGGFDERYFLYLEEADFMVRVGGLGWVIECVPDAVAHQSSAGLPVHLLTRNRLLFVRRHAPRWLPLEFGRLVRQIVGLARHRRTRRAVGPAIRGLVAGLAGRRGPVDSASLAVRIDPEWRYGLRLR